jgi:hypothetical protein
MCSDASRRPETSRKPTFSPPPRLPHPVADDDGDLDDDSDSPIFDSYYEQGGSEAIRTMTNLTVTEFHLLYALVEPALSAAWNTRRGRRSTTAEMMLSVLKHYSTWDKHAVDFGYKGPTFEKMIHRVIDVVSNMLIAELIVPVTMASQRANNALFRNYPYAMYATDVKFQPSLCASGRFEEVKRYFSGKHGLYGYKIEVSVAPPGAAVFWTAHAPCSVSDLTMMINHIDDHVRMLRKSDNELLLTDHGEESHRYGESWAVLYDKGYQGAASAVRAIHPKRRPQGGQLTDEEVRRNERVSSDRVLVKIFFGRMCNL